MRNTLWLFVTTATLATALLAVACGDDDDNVNTVPDGGTSTSSSSSSSSSGSSGNPDAGDTGAPSCTFASFTIDLITNHTNAKDSPVAIDGLAACAPSTSQDEFAPVFVH